MTEGFVPPPSPYDRLDPLRVVAESLPGGAVDLSVGTPMDPPPAAAVAALAERTVLDGEPPLPELARYREVIGMPVRDRDPIDRRQRPSALAPMGSCESHDVLALKVRQK